MSFMEQIGRVKGAVTSNRVVTVMLDGARTALYTRTTQKVLHGLTDWIFGTKLQSKFMKNDQLKALMNLGFGTAMLMGSVYAEDAYLERIGAHTDDDGNVLDKDDNPIELPDWVYMFKVLQIGLGTQAAFDAFDAMDLENLMKNLLGDDIFKAFKGEVDRVKVEDKETNMSLTVNKKQNEGGKRNRNKHNR